MKLYPHKSLSWNGRREKGTWTTHDCVLNCLCFHVYSVLAISKDDNGPFYSFVFTRS